MKNADQLKALIKNMSVETGVNTQILLRNYMLERLLERISVSKYKNDFILKGGMLISAMVGINTRSTMDMDTTIKDQAVNKDNITKILNEIVSMDIGDNVKMQLSGIDEIRDEAEYMGFRASIMTEFDGVKNDIKLDMTTGDKIVPREISYKFRTMFGGRYLDIMAYNIETVLAEKLETIISRSTANTRMRDFYDVYVIMTMYKDSIDTELFDMALKSVCENRKTEYKFDLLDDIRDNKDMNIQWKRYQDRYEYAKEIEFNDIIDVISENTIGMESQTEGMGMTGLSM